MGSRGPVSRKRRANLPSVGIEPPDMPTELCGEAAAQWQAFWSDQIARALTVADRGVVLRWITSTNRYLIASQAADEQPLVKGSQGQDVANPLYSIAAAALGAVERCEAQMGVGPAARARLGLAIVTERRSLDDLNAGFMANLTVVSDDPDPRGSA